MNLQSCTVLDNKQKTSKKHLSIACLCFHLYKWFNIWDMHKMFNFFICCFIFFYLPFHTCRADTRRLTILGLSWLKLVCWCLTRFISAKKNLKQLYTDLPPSEGPKSLMGMLAKWRGSARMDSSRWIAHLWKEGANDKVGAGLAWLPPEVSAADVSLAQFDLSLRQHWKKR